MKPLEPAQSLVAYLNLISQITFVHLARGCLQVCCSGAQKEFESRGARCRRICIYLTVSKVGSIFPGWLLHKVSKNKIKRSPHSPPIFNVVRQDLRYFQL